MIDLDIFEEAPVELEYVEAHVKPEQDKQATPGYERQTIVPDPGFVLSSVEIGAIPDPTDRLDIFTNGEHHVERVGVADVQVPQGVFPEGTLDISQNGTYDVEPFASVRVVVPERIHGRKMEIRTYEVTWDLETNIVLFSELFSHLSALVSGSYGTPGDYTFCVGASLADDTPPDGGYVAATLGFARWTTARFVAWYRDGDSTVREMQMYVQNIKHLVEKGSLWRACCVTET